MFPHTREDKLFILSLNAVFILFCFTENDPKYIFNRNTNKRKQLDSTFKARSQRYKTD